MGTPTRGEVYAQLLEHCRKAEEAAAMLGHLANAEGNTGTNFARAWLMVSEQFKKMQYAVTELAMSGFKVK